MQNEVVFRIYNDKYLPDPIQVKYGAAANTFLYLDVEARKFLSLFKEDSSPVSTAIRRRGKFVAMNLLHIWLPIDADDSCNFIPRYIFSSDLNRIYTVRKIETLFSIKPSFFSADSLLYEFKYKSSQNLIPILIATAFLEGRFSYNNLHLVLSRKSAKYYFALYLGDFWQDFKNNRVSSTVVTKFDLNFSDFVGSVKNHEWWRLLNIGSLSLRNLFLQEIFIIVFRIHLTSNILITSIVNSILGENLNFQAFINYIKNKRDNILNDFLVHLTDNEKLEWLNFINLKALGVFDRYTSELSVKVVDLLNKNDIKFVFKIPIDMYMRAANLNIPNLIKASIVSDIIKCNDPLIKKQTIEYLFHVICANWMLLSQNNSHALWDLVDEVSDGLYDLLKTYNVLLDYRDFSRNFLEFLLFKAIQFRKNNLVDFLISQFPGLSSSSLQSCKFLLTTDSIYLGKTLIDCARLMLNQEEFDKLKDKLDLNMRNKFAIFKKVEISNDDLSAGDYDNDNAL